MDAFNGKSHLEGHLASFSPWMLLLEALEDLKFKAFPCTLKRYALGWFFNLPPGSIHLFDQLHEQFITHSVAGRALGMNSSRLPSFKQRNDKSLHFLMDHLIQRSPKWRIWPCCQTSRDVIGPKSKNLLRFVSSTTSRHLGWAQASIFLVIINSIEDLAATKQDSNKPIS